jgi:hypothetical protein
MLSKIKSAQSRSSPEATFARGRPPSQAAQLPRPFAPRDAQESAPTPCAGVPPAPCRPDAHRSVRPRPPALVRHTTARASRRRHRWSGRSYLSARLSSSRRPTPLPPLYRARRGRRLARLLATARVSSSPRTRSTSLGRTLPICVPPSPEPRAAAGGAVGYRRAPSLGQP